MSAVSLSGHVPVQLPYDVDLGGVAQATYSAQTVPEKDSTVDNTHVETNCVKNATNFWRVNVSASSIDLKYSLRD